MFLKRGNDPLNELPSGTNSKHWVEPQCLVSPHMRCSKIDTLTPGVRWAWGLPTPPSGVSGQCPWWEVSGQRPLKLEHSESKKFFHVVISWHLITQCGATKNEPLSFLKSTIKTHRNVKTLSAISDFIAKTKRSVCMRTKLLFLWKERKIHFDKLKKIRNFSVLGCCFPPGCGEWMIPFDSIKFMRLNREILSPPVSQNRWFFFTNIDHNASGKKPTVSGKQLPVTNCSIHLISSISEGKEMDAWQLKPFWSWGSQ